MSAIFLRETDVDQLLDMNTAIEVVEEAFRQLAAGGADNQPRRRVRTRGIVLHSMSAAAEYLGRVGWKQYTTTREAARFKVGLYDSASGQLEALLEANLLGQIRTGAATGVALRHLSNEDADCAALFGTGWQAKSQLAAIAAVRSLRSVRIHSRNPEHRDRFVNQMQSCVDVELVAVDTPAEAIKDVQIVVTATSAGKPLFDGSSLVAGATVCAIGCNSPNRAEIDVATVQRAAGVVCDSVDACRLEAGELIAAAESGVWDWSAAVELEDVVSGQACGREQADDIVVFKSVGLAIQDVALASRVVDLARQKGLGSALPF